MWRRHFPIKQMINPSEVLVSSDESPPFYNIVCLNFQVCAKSKWRPDRVIELGKRWFFAQVFANLTVLALEEVLISMFRSSGVITFLFDGITRWHMFLPLYEGHRDVVSIQSSINLGETLFRITCEWITAEIKTLARLCICQSFSLSQFLDLIYCKVTIFIFDGVTLQTNHSVYMWS